MIRGTHHSVATARRLRRSMTLPEVLIWRLLRRQACGLKFRRQHAAGPYVLDFFCASARLAIEIDGLAHDAGGRLDRDAARDAWLAAQGLVLMRLPAADVLNDPEGVACSIVRLAEHLAESAPPPR